MGYMYIVLKFVHISDDIVRIPTSISLLFLKNQVNFQWKQSTNIICVLWYLQSLYFCHLCFQVLSFRCNRSFQDKSTKKYA